LAYTKFFGAQALFTIIQAAGWPIWPLLICSILALALVIERLMTLRTQLVAPEGLLEQAIHASQNNLPSEEAMQQLHDNSVLGCILASGLHAMKDEPLISAEDLRSSMESAGRKAAHELEKYLVALATIASAAPLLGLLGTVIGMIDIFGSQAPGTSNPVQLAQGISIALYNTAFGLIIAIPALMFWRCRLRIEALKSTDSVGLTLESNAWLARQLREDENLCASWLWAHDRWKHGRAEFIKDLQP
jgi:biopolymer transport protein ExbB